MLILFSDKRADSYNFAVPVLIIIYSCVLEQAQLNMDITKLTECVSTSSITFLDVEVKYYSFKSIPVFSRDMFCMFE